LYPFFLWLTIMKSIEIRQKFFEYFVRQGHTKVASSSLVPAEDPTLLFANAGMNQFKDIFLGKEKRSYTRAVTIQKCIRAGGKHNDLDNVGRTKRHCTFFEMLGNFSFADYFKKEAIQFAWDFLTKELNLPADKLYPSVYESDQEAYDIWHKQIGVPEDHIVRLGRADNFWQMGDTGPCGPCSEIYYDRGAKTEEERNARPGDDCERFLEIWNLVFMQFGREADGRELPLKATGIDTGMGLERLCSVMQNTDSIFETDVFAPLISAIEKFSGKKYQGADEETRVAFRVLAEHIRSACLAIADGAIPSNESRGYVLRKIIRRAALFAQKLGDIMFFAKLVPVFIEDMGGIYPELRTNKVLIERIITGELEKFSHNLTQGQPVIEKYLQESAATKILTGEQVFKLYDTYGFPFELTSIVAHGRGYKVDIAGFEQAMEKQREQSGRKASEQEKFELAANITTLFTGYTTLEQKTKIATLVFEGKETTNVPAGSLCWIIPQESPFYAESGGQVSDRGMVIIESAQLPVREVRKVDNAIAIALETPFALYIGDEVTLRVDKTFRLDLMRNHTATHLLQAALEQVLGSQIKQAGSLVCDEYARFDFTHHEQVSSEELHKVEQIVNAQILANTPVTTTETTYKDACAKGAKAFFGEKYNPESVRLVQVPGFSAELCGGTHVTATGQIGLCKITSNTALSAGVRRITAVTGRQALALFQQVFDATKTLATQFKVQPTEVVSVVDRTVRELRDAEKTVAKLRRAHALAQVPGWADQAPDIKQVPWGFVQTEDLPAKELREVAYALGQRRTGIYCVVSTTAGTSVFFVHRSPELSARINIKILAGVLAEAGIKCGSTGDDIQGSVGADGPEALKKVVTKWLEGVIA